MEKRSTVIAAALSALTASFILVLALKTLPGFADDVPSPDPIVNFAQVIPGLYRGGTPYEVGLEFLNSLKVKTDLDLQGGDVFEPIPALAGLIDFGEKPEEIDQEKAEATLLNLNFINEPLSAYDKVTPKEDQEIDQTLEIMNDPAQRPLFVHCEHGEDRTGLLVALFEVKYLGYSIKQAHMEWEAYGHKLFHWLVTHELDDYYYKKAQEIISAKPQPASQTS
jgi:tyrosine-protein phosphatase SIW14